MCPFQVLWRPSAREEHDDKHTDENNYVLNMKQLALIKSMFDVDIVHGTVKGDYLQRSARMMRATVLPPPPRHDPRPGQRWAVLCEQECD